LRYSKATLLEPYDVLTIARSYDDRLCAITALLRRHKTRRISQHVCGHHNVVLRRHGVVTA